jgi:hypothetical protein
MIVDYSTVKIYLHEQIKIFQNIMKVGDKNKFDDKRSDKTINIRNSIYKVDRKFKGEFIKKHQL